MCGCRFDEPEFTGDVTGLATTRLLEAIRESKVPARFYQASSSEMFGATPPPQDESTPFYPRSPYGAAKVYSYWMTRNYREAYGLFATNGILFNHESPRRGETFVTRKITMAVARIAAGLQEHLYMGNIDAARDWGYAKEYVEAMWRMLQADEPDDFVIATGTSYTVRDFLQIAFEHAGLDWEKHVRFDERYLRPTEVDNLIGDASKAEAAGVEAGDADPGAGAADGGRRPGVAGGVRTALITGAAGQDGILLARQLLAAGYRVIGTVDDSATLEGHLCRVRARARGSGAGHPRPSGCARHAGA